MCFQRDEPAPGEPWSEVPGCIGGSDFTAKTDFCIMAPVEAAENPEEDIPTVAIATMAPTVVPSVVEAAPDIPDGMTGAPSSSDYWELPELEFIRWDDAPGDLPLGLCQGMFVVFVISALLIHI